MMEANTSVDRSDSTISPTICKRCKYPGSEIRFLGCGCTLHVRCTPISVVVKEQERSPHSQQMLRGRSGSTSLPGPVPSNDVLPCPVCQSGVIQGIHIFPMSFTDLDRAVDLCEKEQALSRAEAEQQHEEPPHSHKPPSNAVCTDDSTRTKRRGALYHHYRHQQQQTQEENSHLLALSSHNTSSLKNAGHAGGNDFHNYRTGRWHVEEFAFVNSIVKVFDQGILPLPHGVKLNTFLADMFLCKSSRLTKKMKNAKLSTHRYSTISHATCSSEPDVGLLSSTNSSPLSSVCLTRLSNLQEQFLQSVASEATRLELRFNMSMLWRKHFFSLCLQVGYKTLHAHDWLNSLEEMEQRASGMEEQIRNKRRRIIGLTLKTDVGDRANNSTTGTDAEETGIMPKLCSKSAPLAQIDSSSLIGSLCALPLIDSLGYSIHNKSKKEDCSRDDFKNKLIENNKQKNKRPMLCDDSDKVSCAIDDLLVDPLISMPQLESRDGPAQDYNPFFQYIMNVMKAEKLPFQHADVWVPFYVPPSNTITSNISGTKSKSNDKEVVRLVHAGFVTRNDLSQAVAFELNEYGTYSSSFSFLPGVGLPGRIYEHGEASWENYLNEADPSIFERAGGARVFGIKTGFGFVSKSEEVGRVIVIMYSTTDIPYDLSVIDRVSKATALCTPEPKWKLLIDLGLSEEGSSTNAGQDSCFAAYSNPKSVASLDIATSSVIRSSPSASVKLVCHNHAAQALAVDKLSKTSKMLLDFSSTPVSSEEMNLIVKVGNAKNEVHHNTTLKPKEARHTQITAIGLERYIAALLGAFMPGVNEADPSAYLLKYFISLRLLLLRPESRRSSEESEMLDMLKKSFQGYSAAIEHHSRSDFFELAILLAKDWMYLYSIYSILTGDIQDENLVQWGQNDTILNLSRSERHPLP